MAKNIFALLIGVDLYLENASRSLPDGRFLSLPNLKGAVNDVEIIRTILQHHFYFTEFSILTSSPTSMEPKVPIEPEASWPTHANIKKALDDIHDEAKPGDLLFFYFSGYGALLPTTISSPGDGRTMDPSLMTADYCCGKPAVRGWELDIWLRKFNKKDVRVVAILDTCYSGGARRADIRFRTPENWKPPPNLPADEAAVQGTQKKPGYRNGSLNMDWDIIPKDFITLMAACQRTENAAERDKNGIANGAFTLSLKECLLNMPNPPPSTYHAICDRTTRMLENWGLSQKPQVFGRDRLAFLEDYELFLTTPIHGVIREGKVSLPIGKIHGINKGTEFITTSGIRRVVVSVSQINNHKSEGEIIDGSIVDSEQFIEAIPFRWSASDGLTVIMASNLGSEFQQRFASELNMRIAGDIHYKLSPSESDSKAVWFGLGLNESGNVDIFGPERLTGYKGPVRGWESQRESAAEMATNSAVAVAHLFRFGQILQLRNQYQPHDTKPFDVRCNSEAVGDQQTIRYNFQNSQTEQLYFAVFILSPGFHVKQLFPVGPGIRAVPSHESQSFRFRLILPMELRRKEVRNQKYRYRDIIRTVVIRGKSSPSLKSSLSLKSMELPNIWDASLWDNRSNGLGGVEILSEDFDWWIHDESAVSEVEGLSTIIDFLSLESIIQRYPKQPIDNDTRSSTSDAPTESLGADMDSLISDEPQPLLDGKMESLMSDGTDATSQASSRTTDEELIGKALFGTFMVDDPHFRSICEEALTMMHKRRFVRDLSRLLKMFYGNLSLEAETEAHRATARLLRSKRGRYRISEQIALQVTTNRNETDDKPRARVPSKMQQQAIENWLVEISNAETNAGTGVENNIPKGRPRESFAENFDYDSDHEAHNSLENDSIVELPQLLNLRAYLAATKAFLNLRKSFMLLLLPNDISDILRVTPRRSIWFSKEQDFSLENLFKEWVENITQVRWKWWPLAQRKRTLREGETRMVWRCHCGTILWEEMSIQQSQWVQKILSISNDSDLVVPLCTTSRRKWGEIGLSGMLRTVSPNVSSTAESSSASQRYTPPNITNTASSSHRSGASVDRRNPSSTAEGRTTLAKPSDRTHNPHLPSTWVLLGVQGSTSTIIPTQVPIFDSTVDYLFFRALRECYGRRRGMLRLWLSIWRLDHCDIVKYNRLGHDSMAREYRDFPTHSDYSYTPRGASAKNPPISTHLFTALFYSCDLNCRRIIPHECIKPPTGTMGLQRIPKRKAPFDNDTTPEIWGLGAVHAVSFAYVCAYHILMVAAPFAFFIWWIETIPRDLQNASVPVTVILGLLSLFWSGAGILTSRKED